MVAAKHGLGINDLLANHRTEILRLASKHGANQVRVFGSVARSEATDISDIDFLVIWDVSRISAWGGAGLITDLEDLLGRSIDVVDESTLDPRIRSRVLTEAVPL